MRTIAFIQARMGSSRLPGKVLADVAGLPMLVRVVERAALAPTLDQVVVATSTAAADDAVEALCRERGIACFRGSEDDVLDRYLGAAAFSDADVVVRLTADCPLLDPAVIDEVVRAFHAGGRDYVSNIDPATYPDGLDTEVFTREALERAGREARLRSEREHVTPYLRNHPELFRAANVRCEEDWSHLRWTVDEAADLEFVRAIHAHLPGGGFGWRDVLAVLQSEPELAGMNAGIERNAGYQKSLREDSIVNPLERP